MQPNQKKKAKLDRNEAARQAIEDKNNLNNPYSRFLNARNEDGTIKYPVAEKIGKWLLLNPDVITDQIRATNALIHGIRHHRAQIELFSQQHKLSEAGQPIMLRDEQGRIYTRAEVYNKVVYHSQAIHTNLSAIRSKIVNDIFGKLDEVLLTNDAFNAYVEDVQKVLAELGYKLFPDAVTIDPM